MYKDAVDIAKSYITTLTPAWGFIVEVLNNQGEVVWGREAEMRMDEFGPLEQHLEIVVEQNDGDL
jgi:hypothetical protein